MKFLLYCFLLVIIFSCDTSKFKETSFNQFVGVWEVKNRGVLDGVIIDLKYENGKIQGRVKELNNNKYVKLFLDKDDILIQSIKRSSNFEFILTENKLGKELFDTYDLSTTQDWKVQFIGKDTISIDGDRNRLIYIRR